MTLRQKPSELSQIPPWILQHTVSLNTQERTEIILNQERLPVQSFLDTHIKQLRPIGLFLSDYIQNDFEKNVTDDTLPKILHGMKVHPVFRFYKNSPETTEGTVKMADYEIVPSNDREPYHFTITWEKGDEIVEARSIEELHLLLSEYIGSRFVEKLYSIRSSLRKELPGYTFLICIHVSPVFEDKEMGEIYELESGVKTSIRFPLDAEDRKLAGKMGLIKTFSDFKTMKDFVKI